MSQTRNIPDLTYEKRLWAAGHQRVAGVDEAGRGALAGPVVAAAVIVPADATLKGIWGQVRDSKLLKPAYRDELAQVIRAEAVAWAVGETPANVIDDIGIAPATRLAMRHAIHALQPLPDFLLIDWVRLPAMNIAQASYAKADLQIVSVAAASILAKVHRDQLLLELDRIYSGYDLYSNKGYGTLSHRTALASQGPCPIHRYSFSPIANQQPPLFELPPSESDDDGA